MWPTRYNEYGETKLPLSFLVTAHDAAGKPALVLIEDEQADEEKAAEQYTKMFGDVDVTVATRFFQCHRLRASDIPEGELRDRYAAKTPALILLDAKGNELKALTGAKSARQIYATLQKAYQVESKVKLSKQVKAYADALDEMEKWEDRIADLGRALEQVEARVERRDTARNQKNLAEKEEELKAARDALTEATKRLEALASPAKDQTVAKRG